MIYFYSSIQKYSITKIDKNCRKVYINVYFYYLYEMVRKVKISTYAKENDLHYRTVWNHCKQGLLEYEQLPTGTILVIIRDNNELQKGKIAIYCRVNSSQNKSNLESQKQRLLDYCSAKGYVVDRVVTEIGSGLNDNRKKLESLLLDDSISKIVVEHKDRFARFGTNYIELLLKKQGRSLEIINKTSGDKEDLMQDFVSIIKSFVTRLYGQRRSKRKTELIIKELQRD